VKARQKDIQLNNLQKILNIIFNNILHKLRILCIYALGIEKQINHIYLIAARNSEIGLEDIKQLLSPFPNRNSSPLAQPRHHSFFVKHEEKRWPKYRSCATVLGE